MRVMEELVDPSERCLLFLQVIFTNQVLSTWGENRYHLRVAVFGFPNLLSTTGLVEAPAKPKEFYLLKRHYAVLGINDAEMGLEREMGKRVLRHSDPTITEAMKGYVMQALFYQMIGDPFCKDSNCRLYNAHCQEEVIQAQLGEGQPFCATTKGYLMS